MLRSFIFLLLGFLALTTGTAAQQCSATVPCSVGCCSQFGFCGWGDEFCGAGCTNSCDARKQCDETRPCETGCCSKFGFCGLGQDFCGDDCAYQCDQKAQCDPGGWGAQYVNHTKCPLNVCCSKFGFCGMTPDFCGDKSVPHKICDVKSHSIKRVVGYYEGWAQGRYCHRMYPENIPMGIYTHINFAFAGIDYDDFQTIPASGDSVDLWKRVVMLKQVDPSLKIWLAIGGWTFNDPDQLTKMTFSDIVSTTANQDKFIIALVRLMTAFGFDGVDIDWEYPVATERSGRGEDFVNFPIFARRLRAALKNANSEWGVSITLPASFWYLQHFDIVKLQEHVDWFNIMSYDMHGSWDLTTDWGKKHGAQINAHTNLTELADGLDLLWRNNIDPAKVTMGFAFYGRSMTLASRACNQPGCPVASPGKAAPCSGAAGVLLNTEIDDIITQHQLTPTFDRTAAVKMINWDGDQWTSFDDEDTFKIKGNFAKEHCLGGVMVWAISHDNNKGDNAVALANALGRAVNIPTTKLPPQASTTNPQADFCRWTNCGQVCPEGFNTVIRQDDPSQLMLNSENCPPGSTRTLCCPKKELTFCQWRGFSNSGHCNGGCESHEVQVGSTRAGCSSGSQAACCTKNPTTNSYGECKWVGSAPNCPADPQSACPSDYPKFVVASNVGFGGDPYCQSGKRAFCCKGSDIPKPFQNCNWYGHETNLYKADVAVLCEDSCPHDQIPIAKSLGGTSEIPCFASYTAYCCAGVSDLVERSGDAILEEFKYYLGTFLMDPNCPADKYSEFAKRAWQGVTPAWSASGLAKREALDQTRFTNLVRIMSSFLFGIHQDVNKVNFFDSNLVALDRSLPSDALVRNYIYPDGAEASNGDSLVIDPIDFTADFLCNLYSARTAINDRQAARNELCQFPEESASKRRNAPSPLDDRDIPTELLDLWKRRFSELGDSRSSHLPSVETAVDGALNGELTLHYARWLRSRYFVENEVILEVAYWIGPAVGTAPTEEVRNRYHQSSHDPQDRWVVFHFHIPIDRSTFRRPPGSTDWRDWRVGTNVINVWHGQRLLGWDNADPQVDGRMRRNVQREANVNWGSQMNYNQRAEIIACPLSPGGDPRLWLGAPGPQPTTPLGQAVATLGHQLFDAGIVDMDSLSYLWPNESGQPEPRGQGMGSRTYRPVPGAFEGNWLGHGAVPETLDIEGVPREYGGWNEFV